MGACKSKVRATPAAVGTDAGTDAPAAATEGVDWDALRADVLALMDSDAYDDGSYAPVLIRLGWHSAGTFDPAAAPPGGTNGGAGMRFAPERDDPENAGLAVARDLLAPLRARHPGCSFADLWVLAAYCALAHTGGPVIEFRGGRADAGAAGADADAGPGAGIAPGRLPQAEFGLGEGVDGEGRVAGWERLAQHLRDVFGRMGFGDREIVALSCGGHVYGRCHPDRSGYAGAWVEAPTQFSNEYAADLIEDEWMLCDHDTSVDGVRIPEDVRPAPGKRQYVGKWAPSEAEKARGAPDPTEFDENGTRVVKQQMMLVSDMVLLWDAAFREHLEVYAADESALKRDFGAAFKKLCENGCEGTLRAGGGGCPFAHLHGKQKQAEAREPADSSSVS